MFWVIKMHYVCLCVWTESNIPIKNGFKNKNFPPPPFKAWIKPKQAHFQKEARPKEDREILWSALCKQLREDWARNPGAEIKE